MGGTLPVGMEMDYGAWSMETGENKSRFFSGDYKGKEKL